jgi:phosphatidylethanolamine-binding protein (PEBP) family uncharacterized protein
MYLTSPALRDQQPIPAEYAFGVVDPKNHVALSTNRNPPLEWGELAGRHPLAGIDLPRP